MTPNQGQCPACGKNKAMRSVKEFDGREWPGALCRFCSHFVPDIQSKQYDLACPDCGVAMGVMAHDYRHHETEEAWSKRHQERLASHFCRGCHGKRRDRGVDFKEVDTFVRHPVKCDVCKKTVAYLDFSEEHPVEVQKEAVSRERLMCAGKCTETYEQMASQIKASVVK